MSTPFTVYTLLTRSASSWRRRTLISCCGEAGNTEVTEQVERVYKNTWRRRTKQAYSSSLSPTSSFSPSSSSPSSSETLIPVLHQYEVIKHRTTFYLHRVVFSNQLGLQSAGRTSLCGLWVKSCVWTLVNKRFIRGNEAETNRWELTQCSLCFLQKQQPRCEFVLSAAENTFIMFLAQTWFHPQVSTHQLLWVFSMQMLLIDGTSSFIKDEAVLRWASLRYYKHHLICISVCGRQSDEPSSFLISSRQILPEQKIKVCVWRRFFTL